MASSVVRGLDIVIRNLHAIGDGAGPFLDKVLLAAMKEDVIPVFLRHITLSDHTLEELRKLGHPYSRKFGADSFVHPDDMVHEQTGRLVNMTYTEVSDGSVRLLNEAPEYLYLRFGTSRMRQRDPAKDVITAATPAIQKRFSEAMKGAFIEYFPQK